MDDDTSEPEEHYVEDPEEPAMDQEEPMEAETFEIPLLHINAVPKPSSAKTSAVPQAKPTCAKTSAVPEPTSEVPSSSSAVPPSVGGEPRRLISLWTDENLPSEGALAAFVEECFA